MAAEASKNDTFSTQIPELKRSLLNKTFDSYKLKFDHILNPIKNNDKSINGSFSINLPSKHKEIITSSIASNMIEIETVSKLDYSVLLNGMFFYFKHLSITLSITSPMYDYPCTNVYTN